jgi:hypothetical protein
MIYLRAEGRIASYLVDYLAAGPEPIDSGDKIES